MTNRNYKNTYIISKYNKYLNMLGLSEKTKSSYINDINIYLSWLIDNKYLIERVLEREKLFKSFKIIIKENIIIDYFEMLINNKKNAAATTKRKLASITRFYKFLNKGFKLRFEFPEIKIKRGVKINNRFVSKGDYEKMLNHCKDHNQNENVFILSILFKLALRIQELIDLRWDNINLTDNTVIILGKGNKERLVPFDDELKELFANVYNDNNSYVFLNKNTRKQFTRDSFNKKIKKLCIEVGLDKMYSPHDFRHGRATELLKKGVNLKYIKEFLGHATILSTQKYLHSNINDLKTII